eukprot:scaffold86348_cov18-Tisochrysis_lutea.AAC.2
MIAPTTQVFLPMRLLIPSTQNTLHSLCHRTHITRRGIHDMGLLLTCFAATGCSPPARSCARWSPPVACPAPASGTPARRRPLLAWHPRHSTAGALCASTLAGRSGHSTAGAPQLRALRLHQAPLFIGGFYTCLASKALKCSGTGILRIYPHLYSLNPSCSLCSAPDINTPEKEMTHLFCFEFEAWKYGGTKKEDRTQSYSAPCSREHPIYIQLKHSGFVGRKCKAEHARV